jgi:hypothetical protein
VVQKHNYEQSVKVLLKQLIFSLILSKVKMSVLQDILVKKYFSFIQKAHSCPLVFFPLIALLVSSAPLLTLQYPQGHDWVFELVRVAQFKSALLNGQFPPYWGENLYRGYGSPIFIFYAPLYSFVSTLCSFLTGSIASGSSLALLFFSVVGVSSMKLLTQEALGEKTTQNMTASRIAACFFILNPYLIGNKLIRNANAEYAALCLVPLAIYGLLLIRRKPKFGVLLFSASLALTILAHNLTALIVTFLSATIAVVYYAQENKLVSWFLVFGGITLGLGLSTFFWLPAIYYKSLVHIDQITTGKFDFHCQFPPVVSLFAGSFYSMGILMPYLLFTLWRDRDKNCTVNKNLYYFMLLSSVFFLLLQTRLSIPVWERVPFMPLFQFPWRMMGPLAFVASVAVGLSAAYSLNGKTNESNTRKEFVIFLMCVLNAIPQLIACNSMPKKVCNQLPYILKGEAISLKGLPATVSDEYLPRYANKEEVIVDSRGTEAVVKSFPEIEINVVEKKGTTTALDTVGSASTTLRFSKWFFPGWKCTVNGIVKNVQMNKFGSFDVLLPPGRNHVVISLGSPYMRRIGLWVSYCSLLVWFMVVFIPCRKSAFYAMTNSKP